MPIGDVSRAELKYLVDRQREEIKALNEIGRLLNSTTDPAVILQRTAAYLRHAFPAALCGIWSLEQRTLYLMPFAPLAEVELGSAIHQIRATASELLRRPITDQESVPAIEPTLESAKSLLKPSISLRSHVMSPLAVKGDTIGLLSVFSGQAEAFSKEDQHSLGIVAEQLGASLRHAFLVQKLRRADELKDQLLSIISHELNTPLTAIKEGVSMVLDGSLGQTTPDQRDFLGTVSENAARLERLIHKIRTASEIITGGVKCSFESFDLRMLLANVEKAYRSLASTRGVNFRVMEYPSPLFWHMDPARVTQAISQLVENAIQATPRDGFVTVTLSATPVQAQVRVEDTGSGIPKDALPTMTAKIEQLPSLVDVLQSLGGINDRKIGGLGLGLFIATSLIAGHSGTIIVDSTPGEGTWMTVHLPKEPATPVRAAASATVKAH